MSWEAGNSHYLFISIYGELKSGVFKQKYSIIKLIETSLKDLSTLLHSKHHLYSFVSLEVCMVLISDIRDTFFYIINHLVPKRSNIRLWPERICS